MLILIGSICAAPVLFLLTLAAREPQPGQWHDDGDFQKLIQHTTRVPSQAERFAMWEARAQIYHEHGAIRI